MPRSVYNKRLPLGRRGVTLMEVLISIAVVAIGLLGVAALIPVGGQQAQAGARNDRKSNIGRRTFREFNVRGMGSASNWLTWTTQLDSPFQLPLVVDADMDGNIDFDDLALNPIAFCLDPMGYRLAKKQTGTEAPAVHFGQPPGASIVFPYMNRLTLASLSLSPAPPPIYEAGPACEEVFIAQDDLVFEEPEDKAASPLQTMLTTLDGTGTPVLGKRYAEGRYSWFATMIPVPNAAAGTYSLSTVIVEERNAYADEEQIQVDVANSTFPDDVVLLGTSPNLRVGRWIMLGSQINPTPGAGSYAWYRIRSLSDNRLMLSGPLIPAAGGTVYAIIVPNVVNVYTKVIRIRP